MKKLKKRILNNIQCTDDEIHGYIHFISRKAGHKSIPIVFEKFMSDKNSPITIEDLHCSIFYSLQKDAFR